MSLYDGGFYDSQEQGSVVSARNVVPLVMKLVKPRSVVDIGCGLGTWLSIYKENGVADFMGIDGHYVDQQRLYIDKACFIPHDLSKPIKLNRKFDLVQSLEVAEHIDQEQAAQFVESLCSLGRVILFGAAVPYQLGTGHINEQFIDYWTALFAKHGYHPVDCIRPQVWGNKEVEVWYRQNTLLYLQQDDLETFFNEHPEASASGNPLPVIHPELYSLRISMLLEVIQELSTQFHQGNNLAIAENLYRLILHHDKNQADAHACLGQLLAQSNRAQEGLEELHKAVSLKSANAPYLFVRGRIHEQLGQKENAAKDFKMALQVDVDYKPAKQALHALRQ